MKKFGSRELKNSTILSETFKYFYKYFNEDYNMTSSKTVKLRVDLEVS